MDNNQNNYQNNQQQPYQQPVQQGNGGNVSPSNTKNPLYKKWWFWVIIVLVVFTMFAVLSGVVGDDETNTTSITETSEEIKTEIDITTTTETTTQPETTNITTERTTNETSNNTEIKLKYGELLEINGSNKIAVIKAKINSQLSNKLTIEQNYYNVATLIKDDGFDKYEEIQYWAVADMTDGSEVKVISFTLNKDTIQKIKNGLIVDNQIGHYVEDLYIHPSLE